VVEDGADWTKQEALSSVREIHALVWPYIKALHVKKIMKKKLSLLTFRGIENNTVLAVNLNFLEKGQI
jgi:hypothetical protein